MKYVPVDEMNRNEINSFIRSHWLTTVMIIQGKAVDMTRVDGFAAVQDGEIVGLITYTITDGVCEITSLDSLTENQGIGSELIRKVLKTAGANRCEKVIVVTTNDNIRAIRFYQKRGFDMARLYHDALEASRSMKPEIPLIGEDGIPLRHEIEFEYNLGIGSAV